MATWPATLPAPLINSFSEQMPNNILRTSMDKGADVIRRRTTANVSRINYDMMLSDAQMTALDTFYNTTTYGGADAFSYTHPRTAATVEARFVEPPAVSDVNGVAYKVSVQLEILP